MQDWKDGRYIIYLYRYNPQTEKKMAVEKFAEPIDVFMLKRQFGGGNFNIMVKEDAQLIYNEDFQIEGDPIIGGAVQSNAQTNGNGNPSGNPMIEAMRMAMNPDIMRSMFEMFKMASQESMAMMRAQMPAPVDPLATLRNAKEILGTGAPADGGLLDTIRVLKELGIVGSPEKKGITEVLEMISTLKGSGLLGGPAKGDLLNTFASQLPMIADKFVAGLHEYRLQSEATERTIRLQAGEMRPGDPRTITVDGKPEQPQSAAQPPAAQPQQVSPEVAAQIIAAATLHRLVAGIKQPDSTGEDMYDYLRNAWPEILDELAQFTKEQLLMFFRSPEMQQQKLGNTILAEVGNDPRLPKMIEDFLAIAKKRIRRGSEQSDGITERQCQVRLTI